AKNDANRVFAFAFLTNCLYNMIKQCLLSALLTVAGGASMVFAQHAVPAGLPATDALGRRVASHTEAGNPKSDKYVGLFYWTWHNHFADSPPYSVPDLK